MARFNHLIVESNDELPELSELLVLELPKAAKIKTPPPTTKKENGRRHSPRRPDTRRLDTSPFQDRSLQETTTRKRSERRSKQRPLGPPQHSNVNSLLLPALGKIKSDSKLTAPEVTDLTRPGARSSPTREAKASVDYSYSKFIRTLSDPSPLASENDDSFTDLSGFVVLDSASDEDILPSRSSRTTKAKKSTKERTVRWEESILSSPKKLSIGSYENSGLIDLTSPKQKKAAVVCPESPPRGASSPSMIGTGVQSEESFDLEDPFAKLSLYVCTHSKFLTVLIYLKLSTKIKITIQIQGQTTSYHSATEPSKINPATFVEKASNTTIASPA